MRVRFKNPDSVITFKDNSKLTGDKHGYIPLEKYYELISRNPQYERQFVIEDETVKAEKIDKKKEATKTTTE